MVAVAEPIALEGSVIRLLILFPIPYAEVAMEPYFNTFVCVNKMWNDSMNSAMGLPSIELKGGKTFFYGARLIMHLGGVSKAATKK